MYQRKLEKDIRCPFASGLPGVGRHQSDLDHLVSPLRSRISLQSLQMAVTANLKVSCPAM